MRVFHLGHQKWRTHLDYRDNGPQLWLLELFLKAKLSSWSWFLLHVRRPAFLEKMGILPGIWLSLAYEMQFVSLMNLKQKLALCSPMKQTQVFFVPWVLTFVKPTWEISIQSLSGPRSVELNPTAKWINLSFNQQRGRDNHSFHILHL